jgi:ABC-type sugar transport system ATPase subunit
MSAERSLQVIDLHLQFGGLRAVDGVNLDIARGARHALIGPNGAGKTTLINLLTGVLRADRGRILLHGEDITALAPHRRVARGLARTFQINQLFGELSPLESIGLAVSERMGGGADRPMKTPSSRRRSSQVHDELLAIRDRYYPELQGRPPSSEWIGPMAFTPDQLPAIGFLRHGIVIAAGYNGYGGSYTTAAGLAAAQMAMTGRAPDWVPEDVFSPRRLTTTEPIFMTERDGLVVLVGTLASGIAIAVASVATTALILEIVRYFST